jgi:hypothetical protein
MHLIDVAEVSKWLSAAGMQVNPNKCLWFQPAVTYFGFLITRDGINLNQTRFKEFKTFTASLE